MLHPSPAPRPPHERLGFLAFRGWERGLSFHLAYAASTEAGQALFVGYSTGVVTYMAFFEYLIQLGLSETQLWTRISIVMCLPFLLIFPFVLHAYRKQMRDIEEVQDTVVAFAALGVWIPRFLRVFALVGLSSRGKEGVGEGHLVFGIPRCVSNSCYS